MKKFFFIAAMVSVALVSCTKNEPAPSVDAPQEITFMTAPVTKALDTDTQKAFTTDNVFWSWAFLADSEWDTETDPQIYIGTDANNGALISYKENLWKEQGQTHYWPKDEKSRLTFYSYSINDVTSKTFTSTPAPTISCSYASGIQMTGYDIVGNKNIDFMVADAMFDQTANNDADELTTEGVKTLFRHELSNVNFTIKTAAPYDNRTFELNSITLNGITKTADYAQNPSTSNTNTGTWVEQSTANISVADVSDSPTFTNSATSFAAPQYLFIPQEFGDETVTIVYTITSTAPAATETVTVTKKLSDIFGTSWEHGKKYTCNITITLDEILWDPAEVIWEVVTAYEWAI